MIQRRRFAIALAGAMLCGFCSSVFAQDNYGNWQYYRTIVLNTKASGANVAATNLKFPVLIRLTSADSAIFNTAQSAGQDVRFANYQGTHLPYQIQRWNAATRNAELWVLVDSVKGTDSAGGAYPNGYLTMYWGNGAAADSEKSTAVFDTGNGYQAVWHLAENSTGNAVDATINGFTGTASSTPPTDSTDGILGYCRYFNGSSNNFQVANSASGKLNFRDSSTYSISAWVESDTFPTTNSSTNRGTPVAKYSSTGGTWATQTIGGATPYWELALYSRSTVDVNVWYDMAATGDARSWHYLTWTSKPTGAALFKYLDGVLVDSLVTGDNNTGTRDTTRTVSIGSQCTGSAKMNYFKGKLDEVILANITRSPGWIQLAFQNQRAAQTLVVEGPIQQNGLPVPVLSSPANGAVNQPIALSLSWGSVSGAISYAVRLSTASTFSNTVVNIAGLSATSQSVTGLAAGVTYYWEANATGATATSAWSAVWSFSVGMTQVIPLNTAWNMKSLNVIPLHDTTIAVFGTDSGGFLFVKDNAGDVYCPAASQDNINHVQVGQGYQIYTTVADTMEVMGIPVNYAATAIALSSGWNTIAYLPPSDDSIEHALAGIDTLLIIVKNNSGHAYWPSLGIDDIGIMYVGEGYKVLMSSAASLTYPTPDTGVAKRVAARGGKTMLRLPEPRHYATHANTGNNATLLAKRVTIGDKAVPDSSEIGAFDGTGSLVGSGTVMHGIAAFAVWGIDPQGKTKKKDGCAVSESVTFRLWDGKREYPLDYVTQDGTPAKYGVDKVFLGVLSVPEGYLITKFDLTRAYPNPFRGSVKIAFDVPTIGGVTEHGIELAVYDLKGSLVKQLASGLYQGRSLCAVVEQWRGPRVRGGIERVHREDESCQLRQAAEAGQNSIEASSHVLNHIKGVTVCPIITAHILEERLSMDAAFL